MILKNNLWIVLQFLNSSFQGFFGGKGFKPLPTAPGRDVNPFRGAAVSRGVFLELFVIAIHAKQTEASIYDFIPVSNIKRKWCRQFVFLLLDGLDGVVSGPISVCIKKFNCLYVFWP